MDFIFNKHGVCLNPETAFDWKDKSRDYYCIEVAQRPDGRWCAGSHVWCGSGGGGGSANLRGEGYATRVEAVVAEANQLLERLRREVTRNNENPAPYRRMIKKLESQLNQFLTPQLSLF
ncbi:hypothetical protein GCM10028803_00560 [Larkinella knui]|uniref:Uncharacterized protein n=1 Tax=Larkinella knui TaxID=2025310 RepID=A0A3P1CJT8_9BACT|nr:hypothetical protein [Larkinella knui]RRB13460.1 hypothetical protein EHT87_14385 [Larkinella knui]